MKVLVEYEVPIIRHLRVQCPKCKKWFFGSDVLRDINGDDVILHDKVDLELLHSRLADEICSFECPVCGCESVDTDVSIVEISYDKMPKPMEKKIIWE